MKITAPQFPNIEFECKNTGYKSYTIFAGNGTEIIERKSPKLAKEAFFRRIETMTAKELKSIQKTLSAFE